MSLLSIFGSAILPIVAIAASGFALGTWRNTEATSLNTISIYVLMPALVFDSLATTTLSSTTLLSISLGVVLFTAVMMVLAEGTGRLLAQDASVLGSFVLVSVFANSGNYGIPVSEFAFGTVGRSTAVVYVVAQSVVLYTLGVYVVARGDGDSWQQGVRSVMGTPLVYTVVLALAARWAGVLPPADAAAMETIAMVGNAAIPVMLLVLGIELTKIDYGSAMLRVSPAAVLKLLVAPVVAVGVALLLGFRNPTVARVFVLECSMPAAVTTLILTGEFASGGADNVDATAYASATIFVTTLLSVPVTTVLIAILQSGRVF
ncbi:AEC family transporter [Halobacteriales archaeon Cl-PHB]